MVVSAPIRATLQIRPGDAPPFAVEITNTATIGRSRDNTVALHFSPHVSRQHAIIRRHNAYEYQIMDLSSRNGTFVDGRRVGRELLTLAEKMRWPLDEAPPFRIAVALHHGTVTCGNIGPVAQRDATIIGDAVNTAFRMEGLMKSLNQTLVLSGDFLRQLAEPADAYADLGAHELKGKRDNVRLFGLR